MKRYIKPVLITHKVAVDKHRYILSVFQCACGKLFVSRNSDVKREHTTSCGCYARKVRAKNIQSKRKRYSK